MTMVRPKNKSSETESVNCQIDRLVWVTPALLGHPKLPTLLSQIEVDTGIDLPIAANYSVRAVLPFPCNHEILHALKGLLLPYPL